MSADAAAGGASTTAGAGSVGAAKVAGFSRMGEENFGRLLRRAPETRRPEVTATRLARSSSEGCVRRRSSSISSTGKVGNSAPSRQNARGGFVWNDERRQTWAAGAAAPAPKGREAASRCATPTRSRPKEPEESAKVIVEKLGLKGMQSPPGQDTEIHQEVSSIVEELEAARRAAFKAGEELPKPVEVAASALEPLLRLRDVTGAFDCDLTAMPWLPQLLKVFRNVLRTAVDGVGCQSDEHFTSADSGAGGASGNAQGAAAAAAQAAAAAAAAMAALGPISQQMHPHGASECQKLREQLRRQEAELKQAKQREAQLQKDLQELRKERENLTKGGRDVLVQRVSDLEQENKAWNSEWQSVEARVSGLVSMVESALQPHGT